MKIISSWLEVPLVEELLIPDYETDALPTELTRHLNFTHFLKFLMSCKTISW